MECLAATGTNKYYYVVAAGVLVVAAALLLLARRRTGKSARFWMIGLVLSAAIFAAITPNQTFAVGSDCQAVDGSTTPGVITSTNRAITSTSGSTSAAAGAPQVFNAMAHVTPSSGATVVASSLRLTLVDAPGAGSTLSADGLTATVPGEGTYQANSDGTITFTPEQTFHGLARGVKFLLSDTTGKTTNSPYTPRVIENVAGVGGRINLSKDANGHYLLESEEGVPGVSAWVEASKLAVHIVDEPDYNYTDSLSAESRSALRQYLTFDLTGATLVRSLDLSSTAGYMVAYDPSNDRITATIVDQALFDATVDARYSSLCADESRVCYGAYLLQPLAAISNEYFTNAYLAEEADIQDLQSTHYIDIDKRIRF